MHPNSHADQSNAGASRTMLYISARLLGIQSPSLRTAIRGPCENADYVPGQLPFGSMRPPNKTDHESNGHRAGEMTPVLACD
jgi:hypothetical protein